MKQITYYGKSMYDGWYANYFDNSTGHWDGTHARTLKELAEKLDMTIIDIKRTGCRFDN